MINNLYAFTYLCLVRFRKSEVEHLTVRVKDAMPGANRAA
jgi:hypothetical protein